MKTKLYIHTIDGKPGAMCGQQICYCSRNFPVQLVSFDTILRQRRASIKWRKKYGFPLDSKYGHLPVNR